MKIRDRIQTLIKHLPGTHNQLDHGRRKNQPAVPETSNVDSDNQSTQAPTRARTNRNPTLAQGVTEEQVEQKIKEWYMNFMMEGNEAIGAPQDWYDRMNEINDAENSDDPDYDQIESDRDELYSEAYDHLMKAAADKMFELVNDPDTDLRIRISPNKLQQLVEDGKYKTLHDVVAELDPDEEIPSDINGGWKDNGLRRTAEDGMLGEDSEPVYGYIYHPELGNYMVDSSHTIKDSLDSYGTLDLILKEDVRQRSTFTVGDSLAINADDNLEFDPRLIPSRLDNPSGLSFPFKIDDKHQTLDPDVLFQANSVAELQTYVEAQILGGVKLSDIKSVLVRDDNISNELTQQLIDAGIEVEYE